MKTAVNSWVNSVIKQDEIDKYLINGKDFIDDELINKQILENRNPEKSRMQFLHLRSIFWIMQEILLVKKGKYCLKKRLQN